VPIYATPSTVKLARLRLRPPQGLLTELPLGQRQLLHGCYVTLFDANHCPGAAMILFEPPEPFAPVLHTGDMRWNTEAMAPHLGPALAALHAALLERDTVSGAELGALLDAHPPLGGADAAAAAVAGAPRAAAAGAAPADGAAAPADAR
jgi:hypothetical protein